MNPTTARRGFLMFVGLATSDPVLADAAQAQEKEQPSMDRLPWVGSRCVSES